MNRACQLPLALTFILLLLPLTPGQAHPAPFSYLDVDLRAGGWQGALVIHDFDAAHELGIATPDSLLDPAVAVPRQELLLQLIMARLQLRADGRTVQPVWGDLQILVERQSLRLPFQLPAPMPGELEVVSRLFPYDPVHQTFVNIYETGQLRQQAILDRSQPQLRYYTGSVQGRLQVVGTFLRSGMHHILAGPDHLLFLLGLLLLGGSVWRLLGIVTAFTLGHSVTLTCAALGLLQLDPRIVEPAIALSIVVVGVDNLLVRNRPTAGRDIRPWFAAAFGLLHGFGFASVLLEFGLPRNALGWSLASFNLGVEVGQLLVVVAIAGSLWLVRRWDARTAQRVTFAGSVMVIAAGAFWFIQRIVWPAGG